MTSTNAIAIPYSLFGSIKTLTAGLVMAIVSGLIAFRVFPDVPTGGFVEFAGWTGVVLFGGGTLYAIWRMVNTKGPVVTLTATGLTDIRLAAQEIPWTQILTMATWQFKGTNTLVLGVDPAFEASLDLTRMARWSRAGNARMGADGLCVTTAGLDIDHNELARLCAERIRTAHALKTLETP